MDFYNLKRQTRLKIHLVIIISIFFFLYTFDGLHSLFVKIIGQIPQNCAFFVLSEQHDIKLHCGFLSQVAFEFWSKKILFLKGLRYPLVQKSSQIQDTRFPTKHFFVINGRHWNRGIGFKNFVKMTVHYSQKLVGAKTFTLHILFSLKNFAKSGWFKN